MARNRPRDSRHELSLSDSRDDLAESSRDNRVDASRWKRAQTPVRNRALNRRELSAGESDRVKYRGARLVRSLYSFRVSVHSLFSVCSNDFHQAVDKGARQCRLGRSFSTTIIPENFYLSTRPANRTFDTYDVTREGKSSPRAVSSASLALFVFAPTILLRSSVVKLPRGKKLVTRPNENDAFLRLEILALSFLDVLSPFRLLSRRKTLVSVNRWLY